MSECGIKITIMADDTQKAMETIFAFQELYKIPAENVNEIKSHLNKNFGHKFTEIIYSELSTKEEVLSYRKYLKKDLIENIDNFMFSLRNRTMNEKRLWQDSYSGYVSPKEISPVQMKLMTRSVTGHRYADDIELYFDSNENYALKGAVFAAALKSAGLHIISMSSNDEYED